MFFNVPLLDLLCVIYSSLFAYCLPLTMNNDEDDTLCIGAVTMRRRFIGCV